MHAVVAAVIVFLGALPPQAAPRQSFSDLVASYRDGQYEPAVTYAKTKTDIGFSEDIERWIDYARHANGQREIEAGLMLQTEVTFSFLDALFDNAPGRSQSNSQQSLGRLKRLHDGLASMDRRSPFLRSWYLLWGAYLQSRNAIDLVDEASDYVSIGLKAFPEDPDLLLMKGSAREMSWWMTLDNPQRRPDGKDGSKQSALREARDYFRRSVATGKGPLNESHLRLGRVLVALADYDAALAELQPLQSPTGNGALAYLANLLVGEVHERRNNLDAAAAAYDAAMRVMPSGQSAQLAAAHLAHRNSARKRAADLVEHALTQQSDQIDPWWWYIRGQTWQFDLGLAAARKVVKP